MAGFYLVLIRLTLHNKYLVFCQDCFYSAVAVV
jgi:hypothetical protein